ncbi:6,7-dimethyl-8-ribityllumazine synthase [Aminivibrio sp.]|jgi:6,7-dimethyl-8-ribityllumazine synthase|uniref:6,7-dimethyl-8-ribityllumazine synthase n=1 Tax=Aminivibrio sp. TaxID=1872489 RepID=UPI001A58D234|nr:6,7-dimethyl-8-ribityllumazine synthase [Aminivibrio sp.]MBL3539274.1 6,7-dimethyl-8-ribityllumazine synthase [Aminivibrio sp.]MDK2958261.1 6,7-dimethyl-8-ribityllumazine synthase [Synergistaceae bacterium]
MKIIEGKLTGAGLRFCIVVSRFNSLFSEKLLEGAKDMLLRHDVSHHAIDVIRVPGAWELPLVAKEAALSGKYDAIIALGAVIRGDTPHFEYVSAEMSKGLASVAMTERIPVSFGVLTTDTMDQAVARSGSKGGNKGAEAALAAIETANIMNELRTGKEKEDHA